MKKVKIVFLIIMVFVGTIFLPISVNAIDVNIQKYNNQILEKDTFNKKATNTLTLYGYVKKPIGEPLSGVTVELKAIGYKNTYITDDDGYFEFTDAPNGQLATLTASKSGRNTYHNLFTVNQILASRPFIIVLRKTVHKDMIPYPSFLFSNLFKFFFNNQIIYNVINGHVDQVMYLYDKI